MGSYNFNNSKFKVYENVLKSLRWIVLVDSSQLKELSGLLERSIRNTRENLILPIQFMEPNYAPEDYIE